MLKINIIRNGQVTNSAQFETQEELDQWYARHIGMGTFGEHTTEVTDLTEQLEQEKAKKEAQEFLNNTDWKILRHIRQQALGIATSLTAQEYLELEQERQAAAESI